MAHSGLYVARDRLKTYEAMEYMGKAIAALSLPTPDNKAAALIACGIAMMRIADSDPNRDALDIAVRAIENTRRTT